MQNDPLRPSNKRVPEDVCRLVERVVKGAGFCGPGLRQRVFDLAAFPDTQDSVDGLSTEVANLVCKIARYAYRVLDEDFDEVRKAGFNDDELFEIVICAAVGAAHVRLLSGLRALEDVTNETGT